MYKYILFLLVRKMGCVIAVPTETETTPTAPAQAAAPKKHNDGKPKNGKSKEVNTFPPEVDLSSDAKGENT